MLLLEARDRIGGRTYTAELDGHLYEMGGTWVHWTQPHTYREMSRYGLTRLMSSKDESVGCNYFSSVIDGIRRHVDYTEEVQSLQLFAVLFVVFDHRVLTLH